MARFKQEFANEDGWSDWISPSLRPNYRLSCCDCHLVHDLQFKIVKVGRYLGKGKWTGKTVTGHKVLFRARRNKRSTAALRKKGKDGSK